MTRPSSASLREISDLIALDTTSRDTNLPLIDLLEAKLQAVGIDSKRIYNEDRSKANLLATIPADDGSRRGGRGPLGHTDVVPVDGQDWSS